MDNDENSSIQVILIGEWKEHTKNGFTQLFSQLLSYSSKEILAGIYIAPQEYVLTIVNKIIEMSDVAGEYRPPEGRIPRGMMIPIEKNKNLLCFIILNSDLLELIKDDGLYHPKELVSTFLEELLHVHLLELRWRKLKSIFDDSTCQSDLFRICSNFHDEFATSFLKSKILGFQRLIDYDGELTTGLFAYGESIASDLNKAQSNLADLVIGAVDHDISIQEAFNGAIVQIYRNIFEPLSRDAGFRFANPDIPHPNSDADSNWFYREHIKPFWLQIEIILQDSMKNDFNKYDTVIYELGSVIDGFLKYIGVFISENSDDGCRVDFNTGFFDSIAGR